MGLSRYISFWLKLMVGMMIITVVFRVSHQPHSNKVISLNGPMNSDLSNVSSLKVSMNSVIKQTSIIYVVTPTYKRLTQKAEITRLSQSFKNVDGLVWIVVDNAHETSDIIRAVLERSGIQFVYLSKYGNEGVTLGEKGVLQRNTALQWIRDEYKKKPIPDGVICFADDDNAYDLRLFEEMRHVKKVGITAVGYAGGVYLEGPIVTNGTITGFNAVYAKHRKFPIDMAGIVVNLQFFLSTNVEFPLAGYKAGDHESKFVESFNLTQEMLEPFGMETNKYGRKEVLVWHIRAETPKIIFEEEYKKTNHESSNHGWEV